MRIEIRFRALDASASLREHAARRIHFHLSRFGEEIGAVVVRVGDVNGPKGGVDKRCQVTVRGRRLGATRVEALDGDPYAAVDLAVARAGRSVARHLDRVRLARGQRSGGRLAWTWT